MFLIYVSMFEVLYDMQHITIAQFQKYYPVCRDTVVRWILTRKIPGKKIGKKYYIPKSFIDNHCAHCNKEIQSCQIKTSSHSGTVYIDHVEVVPDYQNRGIASKLVSTLTTQHISIEAFCYDSSFGLFKRLGFENRGEQVSRGEDGCYSFSGTRRMVFRGTSLCMHYRRSCDHKWCQ